MKQTLAALTLALTFSLPSFAQNVTCVSEYGTQHGQTLPAKAELNFQMNQTSEELTLSNIKGYVFVKYDWEQDKEDGFSSDKAYRGFFDFTSLASNPSYRPLKYKNHFQVKDFDAQTTDGLEGGMWGNLIVEKSNAKTFKAHYIFQAGDHMGGTIHFECSVR